MMNLKDDIASKVEEYDWHISDPDEIAQAILDLINARLHECVKPLEWYEKGSTAFAHKVYIAGIYCIEHRLNSNEAFDLWIGPDAVKATRHPTLEAAKAAAQAHYAAQIIEGLDL